MDLQFFGANCITLGYKGRRLVIDDTLKSLGGKSVTKADDVCLFTQRNESSKLPNLILDGPGEYEVSDISIIGLAARAHIDESGTNATMFKMVAGDISVLVTGHIYPELNDAQLEAIGTIDVLIVPVGGNGYTVDPVGALRLIKDIEPKLVIPTHYDDPTLHFPVPQQTLAQALKELGMEPKEAVTKLRLKASDISEVTQLQVLEKA